MGGHTQISVECVLFYEATGPHCTAPPSPQATGVDTPRPCATV